MLANVEPVDVTVAQGLAQKEQAALYTCGEVGLHPCAMTAVPYFEWGNRASGDVKVRIPEC